MITDSLLLRNAPFAPLLAQPAGSPFGLATSLPKEHDYEARIEGTIPNELRGTLFRNGPGLFDRAGLRRRNLLDGDGLIQAFHFHSKGVHFRSRFVRTEKYRAEQAAGHYLYATWTTLATAGLRENFLGKSIRSQAGVSVVARNGKLFAFDDGMEAYTLDARTLETLGVMSRPDGLPARFAAHSYIDRRSQQWILLRPLGLLFEVLILNNQGQVVARRRIRSPRLAYIHDFFVSERYVVLSLQPALLAPLGFALGRRSFADSLRWKPERGNLLLVFSRNGNDKPLRLYTEASWMWHALNAYERGDEIIADFVGYRSPEHIIGEEPAFHSVMTGRSTRLATPGEIRRYVINPRRRSIRQEVLATGNHDFPYVNPELRCHRHRFGYFARTRDPHEVMWSLVVRMDLESGKTEAFDFGHGRYCTEPVFVPKPGPGVHEAVKDEPGWILVEVYDGHTRRSFLAVLEADRLTDGPIATVQLDHHLPISFHGCWQPEH